MNKETRDRLDKLGKGGKTPALAPVPADDTTLKETAETQEVLGRHKNDGQKDHKGPRPGP